MTSDTKSNLFIAVEKILNVSEPERKCTMALLLWENWQQGKLSTNSNVRPVAICQPGRPEKPLLVHPRELKKRSLYTKEGRLSFMHAIAHIEFNAINLACDVVYRFRGLPEDYYRDWISVAADEARHFKLINNYLLKFGCSYGDYPGHNGLWDMAVKTADNHLARLAVVPRVLEARGLDVTPTMIKELQKVGDSTAADILSTIYEEEIGHVAAGSHWFYFLCQQKGIHPEEHFFKLVQEYTGKLPRGPFNLSARQQAGFSQYELDQLQSLQS